MLHHHLTMRSWMVMLILMLLRLPDILASERSAIAASAMKLDELFSSEQQLVRSLEAYIQVTENSLETAKRYIAHQHSQQANPSLNGARGDGQTQRFEEAVQERSNRTAPSLPLLLSDIDGQLRRFVASDGDGVGSREAVETITALILVQGVYLLDVSELADGKLMGRQTGTTLSVEDIEKLGSICIDSRAFKAGLTWYEGGVEVAKRRQEKEWTALMTQKLREAREQHDKLLAEGASGYDLFPMPIGNSSALQLKWQLETDVTISNDLTWTFGPLCRGQDLRNASVTFKLYCAFERRDWFWYLQPLKVEVVSLEPYICVFHDFLRKNAMENLKDLASPKMQRSLVGIRRVTNGARVSSSAHLNDTDHPLVAALSRRVQLATGLHTTNETGFPAERLQVCEYGTGGHFSWHQDFFDFQDENVREEYLNKDPSQLFLGDRVATLMIYLGSPVLLGGRTVFPGLGVSLEPEPGAAVYWDNVHPNGRGDLRTTHSGCPVAYGYKWIANKFIRETAQIFRRPCPANTQRKEE